MELKKERERVSEFNSRLSRLEEEHVSRCSQRVSIHEPIGKIVPSDIIKKIKEKGISEEREKN